MAGRGKPRSGLGRRRVVGILAVIGWVVVMVVAAGPRPGNRTWIGLPALDDLMGVAFLILLAWSIVWTVRMVRFSPGAAKTRSTNLITLWLGLAVAIAILMVNPAIIERFLEPDPETLNPTVSPEFDDDDAPAPVDFDITAGQVYVALAAIGVWAGLAALARRRVGDGEPTELDHEIIDGPNLGSTVERMVTDLELASDPRSAVLAAYHRLERTLSDQDRPRRLTETPSEHLERVLTGLTVDRTPFLDLAHVYELARFSDHPITEAELDRAVTDLARARDDLSDAKTR